MGSREREPLPPPYKAPLAIDPYEALELAQRDLRTARRRTARWAERIRRWEALLRVTTKVSPSRTYSSARHSSSRFLRDVPERFSEKTFVHPASASACCWTSSDCPADDTRA